MRRSDRGRAGAIVLATLLCAAPTPAQAFDLFGIHLWGEETQAGQASVADPVRYDATLVLAADDTDLERAIAAGSLLIGRQRDAPAGTVGLIQRARDDQANLIGLLYEKGYFGAIVAIAIDGRPLESLSVTETFADGGAPVGVAIAVDPGPAFAFGVVSIAGEASAEAEAAVAAAGLKRGAPASSIAVRAGAEALVRSWQERGHPFAEIAGQEVVADHATQTLDVSLAVSSGRHATIGDVTVSGTTALDPDFVLQQAEVPVGADFHPDIIAQVRRNLGRIDALGSAIVKTGAEVDAQGRVPLLIEVSERKARTIGVGGYYSTTDGPGAEFFWLHRNLFGAGERLRLEAEAGRETATGSFDNFDTYNWRAGLQFDKPGVYGPRVDYLLKGVALQEDVNPYFRRGVVVDTGLSWRASDALTLSAALSYDWSHIEEAYGEGDYSLLSLPLAGAYDTRDTALDATSGVYVRLLAEPTFATNRDSAFVTGDSELRLYHAFDDEARMVLAGRAKVGSVFGTGLHEVPAHRRFYAGGGGSVRGYEYLDIGPRIPRYGPTGGLSRIEGSLEARVRLTDTIGIVPFVDAGYVAETPLFGGDVDFQMSAGLGLRYYTAVGPIRLDVAVPINPRRGDPHFAVYFAIGQSF